MGEESIRRPPESKKAPITCAQASRAIGSLPTLKVIQLPSPTAGSSSPVEGIGLPSTRPVPGIGESELLAALDAAESVRSSVASTCSGRANGSQAECLVPLQVADLRGAQAVAVGQQDHGRIERCTWALEPLARSTSPLTTPTTGSPARNRSRPLNPFL